MFRVITKADYWACLEQFPDFEGPAGLKHVQDLFVLERLRGADRAAICEAGGGNSRILARLCRRNECWNVDKLEGAGQGPVENRNAAGVRLVRAYMGEFSAEIPSDHFDYVVSISVLEHVSGPKIEPFLRDCLRALRPGGLMLHAVDLYLPDPGDADSGSHSPAMLRALLDAASALGPRAAWLEPPLADEHTCARACHATNTDQVLFAWNKTVPALKNLRARAQSCSLAMGMVKREP